LIEDAQLHYVDSIEDAQQFLAWVTDLAELRAPVAVDTETTGLKWWTPRFVRLVQFGTADEAWALDTERWRGAAEESLQLLVNAGCPFIFHNCSFDMHALESDGYPAPDWTNVHDTMFAHHLMFPHESHALKTIAASIFGNEAYVGQSNLKSLMKRTDTDWATVETRQPDYWAYGCMDTILTYRVGQHLFPLLREYNFNSQYDKALARREIMQRSETRGMRVDIEWATDLRNQWTIEAVALADQLEAAGIKNPRSNSQVTNALAQLDWEPDEFTPTGAAKLDKVILNQLSALRPEWSEVAVPLLRYRRLTKWISAYLDPFIDDADDNGHIHHTVRTLRAVTGRDSITEPPMQTLPARDDGAWMIRRCITPEPAT
jgi:DNA polymerase I